MSVICFDDYDDDLPRSNRSRGRDWGAERWVPSYMEAEEAFTKMSAALLEAIIAARCNIKPQRPPKARRKRAA